MPGFPLKKPTGLRVKPADSTGMTGKSSGRTMCVRPKQCHKIGSLPASTERSCNTKIDLLKFLEKKAIFIYIWLEIHPRDPATTLGHHMTGMPAASTDAYVCCIQSKSQGTQRELLLLCRVGRRNGVGQEAGPVRWGVKGSMWQAFWGVKFGLETQGGGRSQGIAAWNAEEGREATEAQ